MTPDREPVGQAVNSIITALDVIACMALARDTYDEVAEEEETLKFAAKRIELILRLIKQQRASRLRVVK
jgi:hypothetical protein